MVLCRMQLFAKLPSTLPNGHGLLCRVLRKIELDVNAKITLAGQVYLEHCLHYYANSSTGSKVGASDERSHARRGGHQVAIRSLHHGHVLVRADIHRYGPRCSIYFLHR